MKDFDDVEDIVDTREDEGNISFVSHNLSDDLIFQQYR